MPVLAHAGTGALFSSPTPTSLPCPTCPRCSPVAFEKIGLCSGEACAALTMSFSLTPVAMTPTRRATLILTLNLTLTLALTLTRRVWRPFAPRRRPTGSTFTLSALNACVPPSGVQARPHKPCYPFVPCQTRTLRPEQAQCRSRRWGCAGRTSGSSSTEAIRDASVWCAVRSPERRTLALSVATRP